MISFKDQGAFFCSILIWQCLIILQRENEVENHHINRDQHLNKESEIQISQKAETDTLENLWNYSNRAFPSVLTLAVSDAIQEDAIRITLENQEKLPEVTTLKHSLRILVWKGTKVPIWEKKGPLFLKMLQKYPSTLFWN